MPHVHFATYADLSAALALNPTESAFAFRFLPEYGPATFTCATCGAVTPLQIGCGGTGYGVRRDRDTGAESFHCYDCCAASERAAMVESGRGCLYLTGAKVFGLKPDAGEAMRVTDWTGRLAFPVRQHWTGAHNMARVQDFVRFNGPDGFVWSGRRIGENTQICHVRRTRERVA